MRVTIRKISSTKILRGNRCLQHTRHRNRKRATTYHSNHRGIPWCFAAFAVAAKPVMNLVKFTHPGNQHIPPKGKFGKSSTQTYLGKRICQFPGGYQRQEERFYEEKQVGKSWVVDKWSSQEHTTENNTTENNKANKQLLHPRAKHIITNLHHV